MDLFTRKHLHELLQPSEELCLSIYLPTHRKSPDTDQDPIRFKNLLQSARHALEKRGVAGSAIRRLLEPADKWLPDVEFWLHQSDGLAAFLTESSHRRFRLPRAFQEELRIEDHCYVTPLVPLLQSNGTFYLLAVSQNACRLFVGNRDTIQELDKANLPAGLRSALGWWRERQLQLHSMQRKPQSRGGDDAAIYHGHEEEATDEDLKAYFRRIDAGVTEALRGEKAPLVFAGVASLFPIYQGVNGYKDLCQQPLPGNPDDASAKDLHRKAWEIVRPKFDARQEKVRSEYPQRAALGTATHDITSILHAAGNGLVETLLIRDGAKLPGRFDVESGRVDIGPNEHSGDLLDWAVRLTLQTSGEVLILDEAQPMPHDTNVLALLRAPLTAVAP